MTRGLALVWAVGIGVVFVALDPAQAITGDAAWQLVIAVLSAVAWLTACVGAGGAALSRWVPDLLSEDDGVYHSLGLGMLIWGLLLCALALVGGLGVAGLWMVAATMAAG
ncbi:MAG: hypothetical protein AAFV53_24010, partial [Myxococcota bacterium]